MADTLQDSYSSFRELRLAAGYTISEVAKALRVHGGTVWRWDHGLARPPWPYPENLSRLFHKDVTEIIAVCWKKNLPAFCDCGCGKPMVLPNRNGARRLDVEFVCESCGEVWLHGGDKRKHRRKLCELCQQEKQVTLRCVGFPWNGVNHHAISCRRRGKEKRFYISELAGRSHKLDDGRHAFVDLDRGEFRCRDCAGALTFALARKTLLIDKWNLLYPNINFPGRIRTLSDLRRVQCELFKDATFRKRCFTKRTPESDRKRGRSPLSFSYRKRLPMWLRGICICGTFVLSDDTTAKFHAPCAQKDRRGKPRGQRTELQRHRGGQRNLDSLRRNLDITIRRVLLHESWGEIVECWGVAKGTAQAAVTSILQLTPEEHLVAPQFKPLVSALKAVALGGDPVQLGNLPPRAFHALIHPYASAKNESPQT